MRKPPKRSRTIIMIATAISLWALSGPGFATGPAFDQEIHLKGTSNTRDIGGYQTRDQRILREGQIIRSDKLSRLTTNDFEKLEAIGVKTVIDLRSKQEHEQSPTIWQGDNPPQFYHLPVGDAKNDWFTAQRRMMKKNKFTEKQALQHMENGYRMIANEGSTSYQKLITLVLDQSNWPILIHCTAGKDRTGVAVALIMEAVGVNRSAIMDEFLLTNDMSRVEEKAARLAKQQKQSSRGTKLSKPPSAAAWEQIIGVGPEMLETFYASVDEQYGSMNIFLTELGADQEAREELIASLTTQKELLALQ